MWPGLPSTRKGGLVIQPTVDGECQGNVVTSGRQVLRRLVSGHPKFIFLF